MKLIFDIKADICPANQRLRPGRGRLISGDRYAASKQEIYYQAIMQTKGKFVKFPVFAIIETYYPRKADVDAFVKIILDALQGIAYTNDDQVESLFVNKNKKGQGRIIVQLFNEPQEYCQGIQICINKNFAKLPIA